MKRFLLFGLALLVSSFTVSHASADLIITEFMANPSNLADSEGEYFELYNSGPLAVDIGTLTISDDDTNSVDLTSFAGTLIGVGDFLVFGNSAQPYVDVNYSVDGSYTLANGADEIVVSVTGGAELARVNYSDGDPFGSGVAAVLNNTGNAVGGVTNFSDYIAEVAANDTLGGPDIGSPGVAGSTIVASSVPEPTSAIVIGLGSVLLMVRRRR